MSARFDGRRLVRRAERAWIRPFLCATFAPVRDRRGFEGRGVTRGAGRQRPRIERRSGAEREACRQPARRDWETLLLHRAAELVPGGRLILAPFARDGEGRYFGRTRGVSVFETANDIWRSFVNDGSVTREYMAIAKE